MMITAANGIARILKAEGVSWVSTFPTCAVNNALGQEGVPLLMMREERYAVAVADAFSRVTGGKQIGVCTVMGAVNAAGLQMAYGALAQAFEDSSPVLCIADGIPLGGSGNTHYDINMGFHAITKWIGYIDQPQRVPEFMRRAFTYLRTGRRGPVLLTLPKNVGEYDEETYPYTPVKGWRWGPDPTDVKAAAKALVEARSPLLYVGEGVFYADATEELLGLAELLQVPVLTTIKAKSAFPETHPLSVGVRGELADTFLHGCDLLFAIGSSLSPGRFSHAIPNANAKRIVQCTLDELDINKSYEVDIAVIGDAKLTLQALLEELRSLVTAAAPKARDAAAEIGVARERFMAEYLPLMESAEVPLNPYRVFGELAKAVDPERSFITHDSGTTRDQITTVLQTVAPHSFMGWGNVSTLGFGLAAAMAAKLAHPDWQCINITGDAGVSYMIGNFESLVRSGVGVTTIHISNGGFAGYGPGFWGEGHDPYTWQVLDTSAVSMFRAAEAMGYYAEEIREPADIAPALERAFAENSRGRPAYLEFVCSQYPVYGKWATGG